MGVDRKEVLLAMQSALLGETSPPLRAVTLHLDGDHVHFNAYYDGPVSEDDVESMACVDTELVAILTEDVDVTHDCIRLDAPAQVPHPRLGSFVYLRRE